MAQSIGAKIEIPRYSGKLDAFDEHVQICEALMESEGIPVEQVRALVDEDDDAEPFQGNQAIKAREIAGVIKASLRGAALAVTASVPPGDLPALLRTLKATYDSQSATARLAALKSLLFTDYKEGSGSVLTLLQKKESAWRCRLRGEIRDEELLIAASCLSMPSSWNAVVIPLVQEEGITFQRVRERLLEHGS